MDLISIIVPIYKVEEYLDKCIESIVNQTYTNLEIILVDDGSPDNCPLMCDEWAKKDSRIKVIHKTNGGLSDARNAGLSVATGSYIGFIDSDDWIRSDMYELLLSNLINNNCDISVCGIQCVSENETFINTLTPNGFHILDADQAMLSIINEDLLKQPVWYKLYRRATIEGIKFPIGKCHEDVFWSYKAIGNASRVCVCDDLCYFYRQRNDSIMGKSFSIKHYDSLEAKIQRVEYITKHFPSMSDNAKIQLWFSCIYAAQMTLRYLNKSHLKQLSIYIEQAQTLCQPHRWKRMINFKQWVWVKLSQITFIPTCRLRNLLKIGL